MVKPQRYEKRRENLLRRLKKAGPQALLITNFTNVSYLTGFSGDDSYLLVSRERTILISDSRYETQIADECPGLEAHIRSNRTKIGEAAGEVVRQLGIRSLGFEAGSVTYAAHEQFQEQMPETELVSTHGLVEELRSVKDGQEIAEIRKAISQAERGFAIMRALLTPQQSELSAAHELEHGMRRFGASKAAFPPIVAVGARAALPHARPSEVLIGEADFVLVDWGATTSAGYRSDLTRVLATGNISPKLEKVYRVVLAAQLAGIAAIRPGVRCSEVDRAARGVIEEAGYGKHFGHGLGHGIGLDIHEEPRLSPISNTELRPGMIVTVEPGIYLPGWGGVRIEDDVLVTRDGHEVLTSVPKQLAESVL